MAVNKVQLADGTVLMDVTGNTVAPGNMLKGVRGTAANGQTVVGTIGNATTTTDGLMSAADKTKLDSLGKPLWVNMGTISSLPITKSCASVTTDMVCDGYEAGNPDAIIGGWTINTDTAGKITISGTIEGTTTLKIHLTPSIEVTATAIAT